MKKILLIVPFLMLLVLCVPNAVRADCIPIGQYDNFNVEENQTLTLYLGGLPIVRMDVNCSVDQTSRIRLLKASVCDGDGIEIDGFRCSILTAKLP